MSMTSKLLFNPIVHRIVLEEPAWLTPGSSWREYAPFAMFLVSAHRPRLIVESGLKAGDAYFAFCQAVRTLDYDTRCIAAECRRGKEESESRETQRLADIIAHNYQRYGAFSTIIPRGDDALNHVADGALDLLHFEKISDNDAVMREFDQWLPKLSDRGIVMFENTNPRLEGSGAHRLWRDLRRRHRAFELTHGPGLGIIAVGRIDSPDLEALFDSDEPATTYIRELFVRLGRGTGDVAGFRHNERELVRAQREAELLSQRLGNAERLYEAAEERRQRIEPYAQNYLKFTGSKTWKVVDAAWRLQGRLAPPGTLRARVGKRWVGAAWHAVQKLRTDASSQTDQQLAGQSIPPSRSRETTATRSKYDVWAKKRAPDEPELLAQRELSRTYDYRPLISILMPVYRPAANVLQKEIESVRRQSYEHWELCLVDGGGQKDASLLIDEYAGSDPRVRVAKLPQNLGIAGNTNQALRMASGEFVALLDDDDELAPHALFEYVKLLNADRTIDVFYSDEDKLDEHGRLCHPFFKPDWSPEYFRGVMYVGHLLCFRRSLIERTGWFESRYDGVQDFELMLRLSEVTSRIHHVPKALYHWRQSPGSIALDDRAKPDISDLQRAAVDAHMVRIGLKARAEIASTHHRLRFAPLAVSDPQMVSIIIPTRDAPDYLEKCLRSIFERSTYAAYEVVLVDNDTRDARALAVMERFPIRRVQLSGTFNYSRANNLGAEYARGSLLLFLNNDTEVLGPDWIEQLLYYAEQEDVGAAGAMLLYPDRRVQHAGVILGPGGTADHVMRGFHHTDDGYAGSLVCAREVSAVTAACLLMKRDDFNAIGGFNEHYFTHYQDVDLCLRLRQLGKRIIVTPRAQLFHHECTTRKDYWDYVDYSLLLDQWQGAIEAGDPYYNPNFDPAKTDYSWRE
jgi:GT2 family glycosyltransferase